MSFAEFQTQNFLEFQLWRKVPEIDGRSVIVGCTDPITGGSCHKYNFCRDKSFVAADKTYLLSRQNYVCLDNRRVLSQETHVCRDKTFVATKMMLVAAPAKDTLVSK